MVEGGAAHGLEQLCALLGRPPSFPFSHEKGKAGGASPPPFLPKGWPARKRGAPAPCGLVSLPPMAHKAHIFPRGVPVTPPVLRYVPDTLRNPSGV